MAERELAILLKAKGAVQAAKDIGKVDKAVGNLGSRVKAGAGAAVGNIARLGVVAGGVIGVGIKGGLDSLASLESATSQVDGAIKQLGLTGKVTSGQIAGWANEIESNVGAAFDDKDITSATATLIRFGHIVPAQIKPAMVVMTDLATKTGSVDSAASLLAKALADPTKAAGKLAKNGVILTKAQQDQIKAFVKAGKVGKAQQLILDALSKSTKGAALASQGPYARSLSTLKDVTEDAERALAEGFLPVIEKVRDILKGALADPANIQKIRDFGKGLAGGVSQLIDLGKNLPWGAIGDAMKLTGQGAKAALDLFTGLPDWVKTAVLTGWGLNKLTGGALGGIVGELGKGLIKGVLGMNAAVVNINAANVNGGGPGSAAGAAGGLLSSAVLIVSAAAVAGGVISLLRGKDVLFGDAADVVTGGAKAGPAFGKGASSNEVPVRPTGMSPDERQEAHNTQRKLDAVRSSNESNRIAIVSAIRGIRLNMNITIPVKVSVRGGAATALWLHRVNTLPTS